MIALTETLWRGPRPLDLRDLIAKGFERVIVLQSGAEDALTDSLYEAQLRAKRADPTVYPEIEIIYIPCSDIFPPKQAQVEMFLRWTAKTVKTYFHCHSGVDRTGFMAAVYRMTVQGWPYGDAVHEWIALGRHWWFGWWEYTLRIWEHRYG